MAGALYRLTSRIAFVMLLLSLSLTLTAPCAAAFDGAENKDKETANASRPIATPATAPAVNSLPAAQAAPSIAYAAFTGAMQPLPEAEVKGTLAQVGISKKVVIKTPATMPMPPRNPAVSTAPMTAGEKFQLFLKKSFLSVTPYALSTLGALWGDATAQADVWNAHDPVNLAPGLKGVALFVSYGDGRAGPFDNGVVQPPSRCPESWCRQRGGYLQYIPEIHSFANCAVNFSAAKCLRSGTTYFSAREYISTFKT